MLLILMHLLPLIAVARPLTPDERAQMEQVKAQARTMLTLARASTHEDWGGYLTAYRTRWGRLLNLLDRVSFTADESSHCHKTFAWTHAGDTKIRLCEDYLFEPSELTRTQILIHELVHSAGESNECEAERTAFGVLLHNGKGLKFYPTYDCWINYAWSPF